MESSPHIPSTLTDLKITDGPEPISNRSVLPKYYQLKHILRDRISRMKDGDPIPSESELCQAFEVSRTTVRKALSDLMQEGLVYTIQGKGTFVAAAKKHSSWVAQTGGLYADITERGFKITMMVLELVVIPGEENIIKELKLAEGETVIKLVRLRFVDDNPFDICTNYLPSRRYPSLENEDLATQSLYSILRTKNDVKFESGVRLIESSACTAEEAKLLQIQPNSPLLVLRSTMFDNYGLSIEHGIVRQRRDLAQIIINVIPH
jgi:GntR family transcriptional regulator